MPKLGDNSGAKPRKPVWASPLIWGAYRGPGAVESDRDHGSRSLNICTLPSYRTHRNNDEDYHSMATLPATAAADDYLKMIISPFTIAGEARGLPAILVLGLAIVTLAYHIWA